MLDASQRLHAGHPAHGNLPGDRHPLDRLRRGDRVVQRVQNFRPSQPLGEQQPQLIDGGGCPGGTGDLDGHAADAGPARGKALRPDQDAELGGGEHRDGVERQIGSLDVLLCGGGAGCARISARRVHADGALNHVYGIRASSAR